MFAPTNEHAFATTMLGNPYIGVLFLGILVLGGVGCVFVNVFGVGIALNDYLLVSNRVS